jgi:rubrerythrin
VVSDTEPTSASGKKVNDDEGLPNGWHLLERVMIDELTPRRAVEFAIKTEQLGAKIYGKMAKKFSDNDEIKELFETLAQDEVTHEKQFIALLDELEQPDGPVPYEQDQYLRAMSISDIFYGLHKGFDQVETREDALGRALQLEKNTILYYQAMRDILGDNDSIEAIIKIEKQHAIRIARQLITGEKVRAEDQG